MFPSSTTRVSARVVARAIVGGRIVGGRIVGGGIVGGGIVRGGIVGCGIVGCGIVARAFVITAVATIPVTWEFRSVFEALGRRGGVEDVWPYTLFSFSDEELLPILEPGDRRAVLIWRVKDFERAEREWKEL